MQELNRAHDGTRKPHLISTIQPSVKM